MEGALATAFVKHGHLADVGGRKVVLPDVPTLLKAVVTMQRLLGHTSGPIAKHDSGKLSAMLQVSCRKSDAQPPFTIDDVVKFLRDIGMTIEGGTETYIDTKVHAALIHQTHQVHSARRPRQRLCLRSATPLPQPSSHASPCEVVVLAEPVSVESVDRCQMLQDKLTLAQAQARYWRHRCQQSRKEANDLRDKLQAAEQPFIKQPKKRRRKQLHGELHQRHLSVQGKYELAIKRNFGHASQEATVKMLKAHIERQTVANCEQLCFILWHFSESEDLVAEPMSNSQQSGHSGDSGGRDFDHEYNGQLTPITEEPSDVTEDSLFINDEPQLPIR